jgi:cytochrome c oxidase cbb3-type subunit 3
MSGQEHDAALAAAGATVWLDAGCGGCHMDDGSGDRSQGAPNLTDAIWLYGGSRAAIIETVYYSRFGVMPGWKDRLSEDEIRAVTFWVHGRGGGE